MMLSNSFMASLLCPWLCIISSKACILGTSNSDTIVQYRSAQKSVITRILPCPTFSLSFAIARNTVAALFPERVTSVTALALGYQPKGLFTVPSFDQARRFWYQWFLCIDGGAARVQASPVEFARIQWETWSPPGRCTAIEFATDAES